MTTMTDLRAIAALLNERSRQDAKWGEQNHLDGTSPHERVLADARECNLDLRTGEELAEAFTRATDRKACEGRVTWRDIFLEEVFEAAAEEPDSDGLRDEVIQSAAVAVGWLGSIERRQCHPAKRVYLSGPLASDPDAREHFAQAATSTALAEPGVEIINPFDVTPVAHTGACGEGYTPGDKSGGHTSSACFMRTDLLTLLTCDEIRMLPGWSNSQGAAVELVVAKACGMRVTYAEEPTVADVDDKTAIQHRAQEGRGETAC